MELIQFTSYGHREFCFWNWLCDVTVNSVNDLPIINSLSSILTPNENQTSVVSINASDVESSSLTYSITGTDASFFNISSSGVITFKSSPDYEAPADSDADNSYTVVITVSDGTASVSQTISINGTKRC